VKAAPQKKASPRPERTAPSPSTSAASRSSSRVTTRKQESAAAPWWEKKQATKPPARETAPRPTRLITLFSVRSRVVVDGLDPKKVNELATRLLDDEERYNLPASEMMIRYAAHDPEATLPLQLDLALRGVPFAITDAHRFTESDVYQAMRNAWASGARPVKGSLGADTIGTMERVLARATESHEHRRWQAALERIADEEPGTDPAGVQFTAE
jgi:hypothetical protein